MINLAGDKTCDEIIRKELEDAGIEIVDIGKTEKEVPSRLIGKCNNFIFSRAWYYWIVTGYMPLDYAKEIYAKYKDLNIRAAGHCGNPPPEEWSQPRGIKEKCNPIFERYLNKKITLEEADKLCKEEYKKGEQFVTHYHIDTQEGLNRFIEVLKKYNIIG